MGFRVQHYTEIDKNKWNNFVYKSKMGWAYHLYDMIRFHHNNKYINKSFAITDDNEEIYFIIQLYQTPDNALESQWGYAIRDDLTKKQRKMLKHCFEDYIDLYLLEHKIKKFDIRIPPLTELNLPEKHNCINPVQFLNFKPSLRYTYVVDLSKPIEKIFADCEETTRQAIRKYDTSNKYSIIESNGSMQDCQAYIKLHKETYTRTGAIDRIVYDKYHENIFYNLIPQNIVKVFFIKDNDTQQYIADVAILIYKNTAYYWWGASRNHKEIGINKYLLFKVICIIREQFNNNGYFETGGAYPYLRRGKYKGLNDYKKCFGTFLHPIFSGIYELECIPDSIHHNVINLFGIKIKYKARNRTAVERERESNPSICKKNSLKDV